MSTKKVKIGQFLYTYKEHIYSMKNIERTLSLLSDKRTVNSKRISNVYFKKCEYLDVIELPVFDKSWDRYGTGIKWGRNTEEHFWFYTKIKFDADFLPQNSVIKVITDKESGWDAENPQFLAFINGKYKCGLDINHTVITIDEGNETELLLYAYSGTPSLKNEGKGFDLFVYIEKKNPYVEKLYYDILIPFEIIGYLDEKSEGYGYLSSVLRKTVEIVDTDEKNFLPSVKQALKYIENELYSDKDIACDKEKVICVGHTHIDVAWKWTVKQAKEKALRSFATELDLIKRNSDFRFMSSTPFLYNAVKNKFPAMYDDIKRQAELGKWEPEGGAWLEFDCNIPSGESIVRQIFYGKKFFKEEFNVDSRILWMPDVFGYSAQLPQIMKKSGLDTFITSKISWNDTNRMPNDAFKWYGADGSSVLAYFISTTPKRKNLPVICGTGYVAKATAAEIAGTYERFNPKNIAGELLCCVGYGDGGGGATQDMIERVRRMNKGLPECPVTEFKNVSEFVEDFKKFNPENKLPVWVGELYLEFHRGTYTSCARNKKYNRQCEILLKNAELLCSMDSVLNGSAYPHKKFENLWKKVLLNQFHDILPGSSIKEVYEDTDREYGEVLSEIKIIISEELKAVIPKTDKSEKVLFNFTPFETCFVKTDDNDVYKAKVPSLGYKTVRPSKRNAVAVRVKGNTLENEYYRVVFGSDGAIKEMIYKPLNRNILKNGEIADGLTIYDDNPKEYDAWNIDKICFESGKSLVGKRIGTIENKAGKGVKIKYDFGNSSAVLTVWLDSGSERLDFIMHVDWHEKHKLLKALFPIDVNTDKAVCEIQFGSIERNTHNNTSWDEAKFEVPAQRFAYLKENGFGVALLNDCKYGYSVKNNVLGLSLLRSPQDPCENLDEGEHDFVYSIFAGTDNFAEKVSKQAYRLNQPCAFVSGENDRMPDEFAFIKTDSNNVAVDTVKISENGEYVVLRIYETSNKRCKTVLTCGFDVYKAYEADLLENPESDLYVEHGRKIHLDFRPYEIKTVLLKQRKYSYEKT